MKIGDLYIKAAGEIPPHGLLSVLRREVSMLFFDGDKCVSLPLPESKIGFALFSSFAIKSRYGSYFRVKIMMPDDGDYEFDVIFESLLDEEEYMLVDSLIFSLLYDKLKEMGFSTEENFHMLIGSVFSKMREPINEGLKKIAKGRGYHFSL